MSSPIWYHFTKFGRKAVCRHCQIALSFSGSSSNLKRHLRARHPTVILEHSRSHPTFFTTGDGVSSNDREFIFQSEASVPSDTAEEDLRSGTRSDSCSETGSNSSISFTIPSPSASTVLQQSMNEAVKDQRGKQRDCHQDALRHRIKKKSGPTGSACKPHQGQVLRPHTTNRTTGGDLEDGRALDIVHDLLGTSKGVEDHHTVRVGDYAVRTEDSAEEREMLCILKVEEDDNSDRHSPFEERNDHELPTKRSKTDGSLVQNNFALQEQKSEHRDCFREKIVEVPKEKDEDDNEALYQFFMSMYNSTKAMPKVSKIRIKRKLFEAVSVEEENMFHYGMYPSSPGAMLANGSAVT